ncbi:MAG: transglutaminase domain-containing protein [Acidobacteria bacterium]|nr:transglutaminase domain-containing protein [Acidobacteriota bacterium]
MLATAWLGFTSLLLFGFSDNVANSRPYGLSEPVSVRLDATVEVRPVGAASLELWIPVPGNDESQEVQLGALEVDVEGRPTRWELTTDGYGNHFVHLRSSPPVEPLTIRYSVPVRRHSSGYLGSEPLDQLIESTTGSGAATIDYPYGGSAQEALASIEHAVSIEQLVGTVLDRILAGIPAAGDNLRQAVLLNEVLRRNGQYIKTGAYGQGNSTWFCLTGQGNCTDFHFTYLDIAERIDLPARLRVGFPLSSNPEEPAPRSGNILGYHCWVYLDGDLGFGIDPSWEARLAAPTGTYFGRPFNDRIKLTEGADLVLSPPIQGEPLPYMFEAYAESDGVPIERIYGAADASSVAGPYVRTTYSFTRID